MTKTIYKNNLKIMLVEPPFYRLYHDQFCLVKYPLALSYLSGSIIKNTDWSVKTYNADFNVKKKVLIQIANIYPEQDLRDIYPL